MQIILHRVNTQKSLREIPREFGVEVDVRSHRDKLILHHDPFQKGESFEDWLIEFHHGTLILNVKEEGLEQKLLELMARHEIEDFFFLDQSFPFIYKTVHSGENRCAIRVSEYEFLETALAFSGKVQWVWVDCFSRFPLIEEELVKLKNAGFKICIVSPELQGLMEIKYIIKFRNELQRFGEYLDAVCTKHADLWGKYP
jgi:hypothetical protein